MSASMPPGVCPKCGQDLPTETNVSRAFPNRWVDPPDELTVIFNGQPTSVSRLDKKDRNRVVSEIMAEAARATGNEQYWNGQEHLWEARDATGRLIDPRGFVPKLHWDASDKLYVNLRPGVGA